LSASNGLIFVSDSDMRQKARLLIFHGATQTREQFCGDLTKVSQGKFLGYGIIKLAVMFCLALIARVMLSI